MIGMLAMSLCKKLLERDLFENYDRKNVSEKFMQIFKTLKIVKF
jgi:hypothetical protein